MSAVLEREAAPIPFARRVRWEEDWLIFAATRARECRMQQTRLERGSVDDLIADSIRRTALTAARLHLGKLRVMGWTPDAHTAEILRAEGLS